MEERTKEQLKFYVELLRLSVVCVLTIGGGVVSLLLDKPISGMKVFFIAFGLILLIISVIFLFDNFKTIYQKIMSEQFQDNLQLAFTLLFGIITVGGATWILIDFLKFNKEQRNKKAS
jgi:hypothetical protein